METNIEEGNKGDNLQDLKEIKLESVAEIDQKDEKIKIRTPKRIVHCSDGIYEEYSDDEDDGMYHLSDDDLNCCCFLFKNNSEMFRLIRSVYDS